MRIAVILFLVILGIVVFSSCESPRKTKNGRALKMSDSSGLVVQCRKALEPIDEAVDVLHQQLRRLPAHVLRLALLVARDVARAAGVGQQHQHRREQTNRLYDCHQNAVAHS